MGIGFAYATVCSGGEPPIPNAMVIHHWQSNFLHLMASVFADALSIGTSSEQERSSRTSDILNMMKKSQFHDLRWLLAKSPSSQEQVTCRNPASQEHSSTDSLLQ